VGAGGKPVISKERAQRRWLRRALDAAINHSMWLYALMIAADLIVWRLFVTGRIM
jgi:choline-glycine betaine transporter